MNRDFNPGTRSVYKMEFETSRACMKYLTELFERLERDGFVLVRDVFPKKVTNDAAWAWTALNLVNLYQHGTVFEIKNKPKLLGSENSISKLYFRHDYTLTVLSQYGFLKTIDDLREALKNGDLAKLHGVGPTTIRDVAIALDEWYMEHGA